jgi:hypothetical protein
MLMDKEDFDRLYGLVLVNLLVILGILKVLEGL